jgi:hypothetical protein
MIANTQVQADRDKWFHEFISGIQADKFMLDADIASKQVMDTYDMLMRGNQDEIALASHNSSKIYFIKQLLLSYLKKVIGEKLPVKMAFDMDNCEILVWAQIKDDDTETEDRLLMIEAEINGVYHSIGYDLTTTIVENRDNLNIPNHYIELC